MHRVARLRRRWTAARFAARMERRDRRAVGERPGVHRPIHIPIVDRAFEPAPGFGFLLGLAAVMGLRNRGGRAA